MKVFRIALVAIFAGTVSAQQPAPASLEGVVVRLGTNEPLSKATVELRADASAGTGLTTTTDGDGKFLFPSVRPGQYRLLAARAAYVRAEYGQRQAGGPALSLTLAAGRRATGVRIVMTPGAVISGRVLERGQPIAGPVFAVKISYQDGQRVLTRVVSGYTNDLGEYHLFWIPPGRYYVVADIQDGINNPAVLVNANSDVSSNSFSGARNVGRFVFKIGRAHV